MRGALAVLLIVDLALSPSLFEVAEVWTNQPERRGLVVLWASLTAGLIVAGVDIMRKGRV